MPPQNILQITKMVVRSPSAVGVAAAGDAWDGAEEAEEGPEVFEVEILFKSQNARKRIDLNIRIVHSKEDEEMYVYNTVLKVDNLDT